MGFVWPTCQKLALWGKLSWDTSPVLLWWLHTNPSNFDLVLSVMNWVEFRRICMESSEHKWANIPKKIFPGMLIFAKYASWMLFFHNTPKNLVILQRFMTSYFIVNSLSHREARVIEKTYFNGLSLDPPGEGEPLRILGGGLPPCSLNPDPISDRRKCYFPHPFSDQTSKIHTRFQTWPLGRNYVIIT